MAGREIDIALDILDRQLLDSEGVPCGKVDDIEIDATRNNPGRSPAITAILSNPGALAPRLGRTSGRVLLAVWKRLHPNKFPKPVRIPWQMVANVDYAIHLAVTAEEAGLNEGERWARERVIERIPGA